MDTESALKSIKRGKANRLGNIFRKKNKQEKVNKDDLTFQVFELCFKVSFLLLYLTLCIFLFLSCRQKEFFILFLFPPDIPVITSFGNTGSDYYLPLWKT